MTRPAAPPRIFQWIQSWWQGTGPKLGLHHLNSGMQPLSLLWPAFHLTEEMQNFYLVMHAKQRVLSQKNSQFSLESRHAIQRSLCLKMK